MDVDINEVTKSVRLQINIKGLHLFRMRSRLGLLLVRIAARIMPVGCEVTLNEKEPRKTYRPGVDGAPPSASDVTARDYSHEEGLRILVKLNGEQIDKVRAYDVDEGWVECYTGGSCSLQRRTGHVSVEWRS